jgi:hypothetical protein
MTNLSHFLTSLVTRLAALTIGVSVITAPIYAAGVGETGWISVQPNDTIIDTPTEVQVNVGSGAEDLLITRHADNSIWYSFNGAAFKVIPGNGTTASAPALVAYQNQVIAFHHGGDNNIYYSFFTPATGLWTAWKAIGNNVTTGLTPSVTVGGGIVTLVYTGMNQHIFKTVYNGFSWSNALELPGNATTDSSPAVTATLGSSASAGKLFFAHRGQNNVLYYMIQSSIDNTGWKAIPGALVPNSRPTAVAYGSDTHLVDVAIQGADSQVHWQELNTITNQWKSGWSIPTGNMATPSAPSLYQILPTGTGPTARIFLLIRGADNHIDEKILNDIDPAS